MWRSIVDSLFGRRKAATPIIEVEYDNGLRFIGTDGAVSNLEWSRQPGQTTRCPVVVHLDHGKEIDQSAFESPAAMRALGAEVTDDSDDGDASLNTSDYLVEALYHKGSFYLLNLQVWPKATRTLKVTVDGRTFQLPVAPEKLYEVL